MNKAQCITLAWLRQSGLAGDEVLLEGLLRRGFLAYRNEEGVCLGMGTHPEDLEVLKLIAGLSVEPFSGTGGGIARVETRSSRVSSIAVAARIVSIPENPGFMGEMKIRCGERKGSAWDGYRNTVWGTKLPVCPTTYKNQPLGYDALDLGVALLVKAFPVARISTAFWSCDGHGDGAARINFRSSWDASWANAVFDILRSATPTTRWHWLGSGLEIEPQGGYSNAEVMNMLNDIQQFARQLLKQSVIDKIGRARVRTLETFGTHSPATECFANEARLQLAQEFG